ARSAAGITGSWGRETESVDNTREKRAAVDSKRNPPAPPHPQQREVLLPAYLAPAEAPRGNSRAQLRRAGKSDPSGLTFQEPGERLDPPRRPRRIGPRRPAGSTRFGNPGELSPDLRRCPRTTSRHTTL